MKTHSRHNFDAEYEETFRLIRMHDAAVESLKAWSTTRHAFTRDEQIALQDFLISALEFKELLLHQLFRQYSGKPIAMDQIRSAAEMAMLRACALEVQLCGTSCVTQLERYSQPIPSQRGTPAD